MSRSELDVGDLKHLKRLKAMKSCILPEDITLYDLLLYACSSSMFRPFREMLIEDIDEDSLKKIGMSDEAFSMIVSGLKKLFDSVREADIRIFEYSYSLLAIKVLIVAKLCLMNFAGKESGMELKKNSDAEIVSYVNGVIDSKQEQKRFELLYRTLFSSKLMEKKVRREAIIGSILDGDTTVVATASEDYSNYLSFMNSDDVQDLDDESFGKVARLAATNFWIVALQAAFKKEKLTESKKIIMLDYYIELLKDLNRRQVLRLNADALNLVEDSVFQIAFDDRLLNMDDKRYKETLDDILRKKNPNAYSLALVSNLSDSKKSILMEFVSNEGEKKEFYTVDADKNKILLSRAAIKLNDLSISDNMFRIILALIGKNAKTIFTIIGDNAEDFDESDNVRDFDDARNLIIKLVDGSALYKDNVDRLYYIIRIIVQNYAGNVINEICDFSLNEKSLEYSDADFKRIIGEILDGSNSSERQRMVEMYTTNKVSFVPRGDDENGVGAICYSLGGGYTLRRRQKDNNGCIRIVESTNND